MVGVSIVGTNARARCCLDAAIHPSNARAHPAAVNSGTSAPCWHEWLCIVKRKCPRLRRYRRWAPSSTRLGPGSWSQGPGARGQGPEARRQGPSARGQAPGAGRQGPPGGARSAGAAPEARAGEARRPEVVNLTSRKAHWGAGKANSPSLSPEGVVNSGGGSPPGARSREARRSEEMSLLRERPPGAQVKVAGLGPRSRGLRALGPRRPRPAAKHRAISMRR